MIKDAEITSDGILIKKMEVIECISGQTLKISKLNQELVDYLKMIEIDVTNYFDAIELKKKNPSFTKLCEKFKLYT